MKVRETELSGVLIIEPDAYHDKRGFFMESYNQRGYKELGIKESFVQDNLSFSAKGVLRGLHFQSPRPQGKLVQVLLGEVFDVAVDIRVGSPTFGKWVGVTLSSDNKRQLYVPPDFAHGFVVTGDSALFAYKCTDYFFPNHSVAIAWDDPQLGIKWPVAAPVLSDSDKAQPTLKDIDRNLLPTYKP